MVFQASVQCGVQVILADRPLFLFQFCQLVRLHEEVSLQVYLKEGLIYTNRAM